MSAMGHSVHVPGEGGGVHASPCTTCSVHQSKLSTRLTLCARAEGCDSGETLRFVKDEPGFQEQAGRGLVES
jgi:hypothetical protein